MFTSMHFKARSPFLGTSRSMARTTVAPRSVSVTQETPVIEAPEKEASVNPVAGNNNDYMYTGLTSRGYQRNTSMYRYGK